MGLRRAGGYLYAGAEAVGSHGAGPAWRWKDGSAITGKLLITQPAPDRTSIPWLLLAASPALDSAPNGMLAHVTYVRRSDTHGGMPPAACDARHLGAVARPLCRRLHLLQSGRTPQSAPLSCEQLQKRARDLLIF